MKQPTIVVYTYATVVELEYTSVSKTDSLRYACPNQVGSTSQINGVVYSLFTLFKVLLSAYQEQFSLCAATYKLKSVKRSV